MKERIELTLPGQLKYLHLVSQFGARVVDSLSQSQGHGENTDLSDAIELALSEAFTNSVTHKSGLQQESQVHITFEVGENKLTVIIKDNNPRFDMDGLPAPKLSEHPESGYGVFILKQIMDTVTYCRKEGWNMITMAKKTVSF